MRFLRTVLSLGALAALAGCGYIHFGKLPKVQPGDPALQHAFTDLSIQHKVLKQELALARKETDALRAALERTGASSSAGGASELARQLEQTTRELAALRASHAKLEAERTQQAPVSAPTDADATRLREENTRLAQELRSSRAENAALAEQLKESSARIQQAQASLAQLNSDLVAQKQARERAEQVTRALRAQLEAVMARAGRADAAETSAAPPMPAEAPTATPTTPTVLSALREAKEPPSDAVPTVELRTSLARARQATALPPPATTEPETAAPVTPATTDPVAAAGSPTASPSRTYTVQLGDTLEKISVRFYGTPDKWGRIYDANTETLGQGMKAGTTLKIPE